MMIMKDPPEHTKLRKLVSPGLHAPAHRRPRAQDRQALRRPPRHRRRPGRVRLRRHVRRAAPAHGDPRPGRAIPTATPAQFRDQGRREPARRRRRRRRRGGIGSMSSIGLGERRDRTRGVRHPPRADGAAAQGPAGRPDHRTGARGDRRGRRRPARSRSRRSSAFVQLISLGRHRDRRPAARLRGGDAGAAPRPAPGAGRRPVAARRTRSRSCCATKRRRRCSRAGSSRDVELHGVTIPQRGSKHLAAQRLRPTATSATSPTPTGSTSTATSTGTSRSGTAPTSASAPRWRASKARVALHETLKRFPTWEIDESRLERVHTQHRARLHVGAHAGALSWARSRTSASAT